MHFGIYKQLSFFVLAFIKKSRTREKLNLSACADISTDNKIIKKHGTFFCALQTKISHKKMAILF